MKKLASKLVALSAVMAVPLAFAACDGLPTDVSDEQIETEVLQSPYAGSEI